MGRDSCVVLMDVRKPAEVVEVVIGCQSEIVDFTIDGGRELLVVVEEGRGKGDFY